MSQYEARISKNADGEFYALIVRIDRDGQASVIHGYKGRHFATMKAAKKSTDAYISKMYATNPARRIGTAHPKRKSEATKKTPTKRLVARRKRNTKAGYYPNPIQDKIALYFNAGNDTNGNPRSLFVVVNTAGAVIGAYDEGYAGESAVTKHYPGIAIVGRFDITPAQRKSLLKEYGK